MRKLVIGILAAAGIALAMPANAQGIWIGAGPVGVGIGAGPYAYDYGPGYRSYAYDNDYAYGRHCRLVREDFGGYLRTVRHCW
jgi:hypothetical protein